MATGYELSHAIANKLLNADGSVTQIDGTEVSPAGETNAMVYVLSKAIPNKFLNPDGTISTLQDITGQDVADLFIVVDTLPVTGEPNKIYLVPKQGGGFTEYNYVNNQWNILGDVDIDLSNYPTTQEMQNAISSAMANTLQSSKDYTDTKITGALNNSY